MYQSVQNNGLQYGLTGSFRLRSALIELGEGKSSSEKMLGLRFLASSIGNSSSCSSGSFSTNDGVVRELKLGVCLSMLFIGYYRRTLLILHIRLKLPDLPDGLKAMLIAVK